MNFMTRPFILVFFITLLAVAGGIYWQKNAPDTHDQGRAAPEAASGFEKRAEVQAEAFMVATANGHASVAGKEMINKGGNAVDAVIAAQMMLNLVEPQSSGIGGGAFLLYYDAKLKKLTSYDGRETAPSGVDEKLFLNENGGRVGFFDALRSGRSIGVPGVIAMLWKLHQAHGQLPWGELFAPAIEKARAGFRISPRLNKMLQRKGAAFFNERAKALYFDESGKARPVGYLLKNPAFANSLALIAKEGPAGFYEGPVAEAIVKTARSAPLVASTMTMDDLLNYKAKERAPVCGHYQTFQICGMGPPSSGGLTIAMTLGLLEPFDLGAAPSTGALHLIVEAQKIAYADRNRYMADPDFVRQPTRFLSPDYIGERRALIRKEAVMERAAPGNPFVDKKTNFGVDETFEQGGTSHISIIDKAGNVIAMTGSIEGAFGSGQMVEGFLLNNELTDFSFLPVDGDGQPIANRVEGGKRPRSSMSPTIVLDKAGVPRVVVGSPGGSRIILFVTKALIAHLDWGMGPQEAVSLFNFGSRNGPLEIEERSESEPYIQELVAMGHKVRRSVMTSGIQMIVRENHYLKGGADPRREGVVLGE